jgi:hypothetical protein
VGSRFDAAFNALAVPALRRFFGVDVQFVRGGLLTPTFTARRGDRDYTAIGHEYGIEITITMRDFMLPVSDLLIDSDPVEPRTGDRIIEGDETFEIQPPDQSKPSVELQAGGIEYLVHTKKIT